MPECSTGVPCNSSSTDPSTFKFGLALAPSTFENTAPTCPLHKWRPLLLRVSEVSLYKIDKWTGRKQSPWSKPSNTMLKNILKKIWNISDLEKAVMKIPIRVLAPKRNYWHTKRVIEADAIKPPIQSILAITTTFDAASHFLNSLKRSNFAWIWYIDV